MQFNKDFIFQDPGFPSFFVQFSKTCDFFFSGHVGSALIASIEFFNEKRSYLGFVGVFIAIVESILLITS